MTDFPFDIVLFDLDGTLVDSALDLGPAINVALAAEGRRSVPLAEIRQLIGGGAGIMLERALEATGGAVSEARFDELLEVVLEQYWAHIADNTVLYDGVLQALDELASRGCTLAVCTNKAEEPARELLGKLGIAQRFAAIYGGDTLGRENAKPAPDMLLAAIADCGGGRAAMVGDTTYDVRAAKAAEIPVVVFTGGYLDAVPEEIGADALMPHFTELPSALDGLAVY
ncbi:HAD-IA family hydrolase [Aurantiacibacter gangjinensis]|uniref:Phosphoglycolate phosphatase n=1 Tax=Aurantiacibacter gangjinensis TaxID=502682 RepID=A0A0G9MRD5_9SPHN|nr:HAD-IA family hydrolase [Aurantiacibacter gangjinensis]KLE33306.1 hypothetical protein AAW01_04995 [Aurantiacibacter gangjinensis]